MKPSELRIGNWIKTESHDYNHDLHTSQIEIGSIESIHLYDVFFRSQENDDLIKYDYNQIEPIPLTSEWLERFGFEKDDSRRTESHPYTDYEKSGVRIDLPYFEFHFNNCDSGIDIEYVHQLQNLYFALTGQELELKELA